MLNSILTVSAELEAQGYPKYIQIPEAAFYALLGFSIVFAGIAFLIFVVWAIGKIMQMKNGAPVSSAPVAKSTQEKTVQAPSVATSESEEIDEETVAVITAAIMAYYEVNYPKCEFTVRRIKKI